MYRYRSRTDKSQKEIIETLRKAGFSVFSAHQIGQGFPDLVLGKYGLTWLAEVKEPKGTLGESQKKFISNWQGSPVVILRTIEDALVFARSCHGGDTLRQKLNSVLESRSELESKLPELPPEA